MGKYLTIYLMVALSISTTAWAATLTEMRAAFPLELHSPVEPWPFLIPSNQLAQPEFADVSIEPALHLDSEQDDSEPSPLSVWSLGGQSFVHFAARQASLLTPSPIALPKKSRIYVSTESFAALGNKAQFLAILYPFLRLASQDNEKTWNWTILERRGALRLNCLGAAPILSWDDADDPAWQSLRLNPSLDADILLTQKGNTISLWQLKGRSRMSLSSKLLRSKRRAGFLDELQSLQTTALPEGRTQIEILPGQVLQLEKRELFSFVITIATPEVWAPLLTLSSPQLLQRISDDPKEVKIRQFRSSILRKILQELPPTAESIEALIRQNRFEEAHFLIEQLSISERSRLPLPSAVLRKILLLRLQLDQDLETTLSALPASAQWAPFFHEEAERYFLRRKKVPDSPSSEFISEDSLAAETRYRRAVLLQKSRNSFAASETWTYPLHDDESTLIARSRKEWQNSLAEQDKLHIQIDSQLGYQDNILGLPKDEPAASEMGHKHAPVLNAKVDAQYMLESNSDLELSLKFESFNEFFRYPQLNPYARHNGEAGLFLEIHDPLASLTTLSTSLWLDRRQRGTTPYTQGYGYQLGVKSTLLPNSVLSFGWRQGIEIDPLRDGYSAIDLESGEASSPSNQSQRTQSLTLGLKLIKAEAWLPEFKLHIQQRRYLSPEHQEWDHDETGLSLNWEMHPNSRWNLEALIDGGIDQFSNRSAVARYTISGAAFFRWSPHWRQGLAFSSQKIANKTYGTIEGSNVSIETRAAW